MIIVYGLGNNQVKFLHTKHNVGRVVAEQLAQAQGLAGFQKKTGYYYTKSNQICCTYSAGYMNDSGLPLSGLMAYYNFLANNGDKLVIIQDDSDQQEGAVKLVPGGGHAGHKGVASVYSHMLSYGYSPADIWRLKIGIRPQANTQRSQTFVLSQMSSTDDATCARVTQQLNANIHALLAGDMQTLQNTLNQKGIVNDKV